VDNAGTWASDGVHLKLNATQVAARWLMAEVDIIDGAGEPANKHSRLDSVIPMAPVPALAASLSIFGDAQPPTTGTAATTLWLSGQLPWPSRLAAGVAIDPLHSKEVSTGAAIMVGAQGAHVAASSAAENMTDSIHNILIWCNNFR
jgi:hypothetical protein